MTDALAVDVVIFGGGAAGLWLLDEVVRAGHSTLLLEAHELGCGQTICSQGIIHGGVKYTLGGLLTPSAKAIAEMPLVWRRCLAGEAKPNLTRTKMRAEFCHLWRTKSLRSRLAMIGARAGLRIAPVPIPDQERPAALAQCPGAVSRLDEQVIEPISFLTDLREQHRRRLLKIDAVNGLEFDARNPHAARVLKLINPESGRPLDLRARTIVLTAGAGNAALRALAGLPNDTMQRRPLHMALVRGDLPPLNGHCVEGSATRATITTARDFSNRIVWQIGGQIAEDGVAMEPEALIRHAQREIRAILPGIDLTGCEWATHRIDRAEPKMRNGGRPDDAWARREGHVITAWPTKLALAPEMARRVLALLPAPGEAPIDAVSLNDWPRPIVALPPWETPLPWSTAR